MKLLSIQVGTPKTINFKNNQVTTGIFKQHVSGPVMMRKLNLDGDGQADLKVHGGVDKAIYSYSQDVYKEWKKLRPQDQFPNGAMGENLTIDSMDESKTYIGDTFEIGKAIIQVSQPRQPCVKLAIKFNDPLILKQFMKVNRPGVYYRVLREGSIEAGDLLKLIDQEKVKLSVSELFNFDPEDLSSERITEILKIKSLTNRWREKFQSLLD